MLLLSLLYIDPGTGSLLVQAMLAGIIGGWVFFKNGIRKFFFRPKASDSKKAKEQQEN